MIVIVMYKPVKIWVKISKNAWYFDSDDLGPEQTPSSTQDSFKVFFEVLSKFPIYQVSTKSAQNLQCDAFLVQ